jgi:hypothetical protein
VDSGAGNAKFDIVEKRDQTVCGDGRLSKERWGDTEMGRQGEKDKGERKKDKGKRRIKNGNYKLKSEKCKVKE